MQVLVGGKQLLAACHPIIHVEFNREDIMEEVVRFLLDLGYDVRFVTVCVQVASCSKQRVELEAWL
jgi:hypothetical protein